ncbi:MAG: hypothetical protein AAFN59_02425, partial [Pseudomonadota bacterium]
MKNARQMRSTARLYAVQALFQMESSGQTVEAIREEFETHRFGATYEGETLAEGNVDLFRAIMDGAVDLEFFADRFDRLARRLHLEQ